jgi:hypothetical protein
MDVVGIGTARNRKRTLNIGPSIPAGLVLLGVRIEMPFAMTPWWVGGVEWMDGWMDWMMDGEQRLHDVSVLGCHLTRGALMRFHFNRSNLIGKRDDAGQQGRPIYLF